jgi:signal peptidase I
MNSPTSVPAGSVPAEPVFAEKDPARTTSARPRPGSAHLRLPPFPDALASLLRTTVAALFLLTFVMQPLLIPSESMERTLLVGDFLLFNKQVYAPAGTLTAWLLPYRPVEHGDIVVFHRPTPPLLIKRVVGLPGDRVRIVNGKVFVNGSPPDEPYAVYEPAPPNDFRDNFPAKAYGGPQVDPEWWRRMQSLTENGDLVVPVDEYFVLGDNRNHSSDSRYWGFVPRQAIVARPMLIYFSLRRPSSTDVEQAADDRLGHDGDRPARLAGFARWSRIFRVVH